MPFPHRVSRLSQTAPWGLNRSNQPEPLVEGEKGGPSYLFLIGLSSWQLSCKPQGQEHTHPRAELYQEVGTCVPLLAQYWPQANQVRGLCGRSESLLGPIPGSGPRSGLVGVRGLCRAAQEQMNISACTRRHTLTGPPPPSQALIPKPVFPSVR